MPPKADWLPSRPSLGPLLQGMTKTERRPLAFQDARELGEWLAKHHQSSSELWVQIFKAGSGRPSVTWTDCVVEAIRFGWIDGQKLPLDEKSYLQRLTPRKPKSNWSAKNREHAMAEGRMAPAGLAHVEAKRPETRVKRLAQILDRVEVLAVQAEAKFAASLSASIRQRSRYRVHRVGSGACVSAYEALEAAWGCRDDLRRGLHVRGVG